MIYLFRTLILIACLGSAYSVHCEPTEANHPIWIDVRTPAEYETGHLPGALNINFDSVAERIADVTPDKSAPIMLYCKSGRRSGFAKQSLLQLGYTNVTNAGGIREVLQRSNSAPQTGQQ